MNGLLASLTAVGISFGIVAEALAADYAPEPVYAKAPVVEPFSWTGIYAGLSAGYGWSNANVDSTSSPTFFNSAGPIEPNVLLASAAAVPTAFNAKSQGFVGGETLGINFQLGQFVAGIESDFSWADIKGTGTQTAASPVPLVPGFVVNGAGAAELKIDAFGTLRERFGFSPLDKLLIFSTAGLAYGHVESNSNIAQVLSPPIGFTFANAISSVSTWRAGWTAGAGVEYAFAPHWSAKAEYLYYDLGTLTYNSTVTGSLGGAQQTTVGISSSAEFKGNIVRGGINYRF